MPAEIVRAPIGASRGSIALRTLALFCGSIVWASAADLPPAHVEFFEAKIRPILVERCYGCHSHESGKSKGDLFLDSRDALRKGGGSGPVIVAGNPDKSLLIEAIRYKDEDLQMPPADEGGKLPDHEIALLEEWVRLGAPDPRTGGKPHPLDMAAARRHWAFQPVAKPAPPAVKNAAWVRTPVDAFVLAQLEAKKIAPAAEADARTLLRRVTYDLTGLPPTPAETDAFLADRSPDAYARAVDRLLASPRYGERWGRFWLDVARYADTKGYLAGEVERRFAFSHTYRDYVIRAFNDDKPFDRFVVEQLAADHLPHGEDRSALAALGFLTLGRRFLNNQNDIIDDRIDVVTRGLMGLTVSCARCHDHKFDPIPTKDYYALHGVFASSEEPEEKPLLGPLVETPEYRDYLGKQAELRDRIKARETEEVEKFLAAQRAKTGDYLLAAHDAAALPPTEKPDLFAGSRKLNTAVLKRWQTWLAAPDAKADPFLAPWFELAALPAATFADAAAAWVAALPPPETDLPPLRALVVHALRSAETPPTALADVAAVYNRLCADADKSPDAPESAPLRAWLVAAGAPAAIPHSETAEIIRRQISTRVADLKREIEALNWTEPGAPLRAMALVDKAKPADSPVLLRGNAANRGPAVPRQFLEVLSGETRAPFHRGSGRLDLAEAIIRPDNPLTARVFVNRVWGWHFGPALVRTPSDFGVRTEAPEHGALLDWLAATFVEDGWSVKRLHRRIVLSATYRQSSDTRPEVAALDPDNRFVHRFNRRRLEFEAMRDTLLAVADTLDPRAGGVPDDLSRPPFPQRRTVYGFIDRQNLPGMFRTFDYPNPDTSTSERFATTVPQQALFMLNSPFVQEQARSLLRRTDVAAATTDAEKIAALYRACFQREPAPDETDAALAFLQTPSRGEPVPPPQAVAAKKGKIRVAAPPVATAPPARLTRWEEFAQVLLLANELAFVD